MKIILKVYW